MGHNIKDLKPQRNSRYEQGYVNPNSCRKLFESQRGVPIIFRSSLEKRFISWCESDLSHVKRWGSECTPVPYMDENMHHHTYNPDFFLEMEDGSRIAIEVKPKNQTMKPPYPRRDDYQWNTYIKNRLKWAAAMKYFQERGIKFMIITEDFFKRAGC